MPYGKKNKRHTQYQNKIEGKEVGHLSSFEEKLVNEQGVVGVENDEQGQGYERGPQVSSEVIGRAVVREQQREPEDEPPAGDVYEESYSLMFFISGVHEKIGLFVAYGFDGIEVGGLFGGIPAKEYTGYGTYGKTRVPRSTVE